MKSAATMPLAILRLPGWHPFMAATRQPSRHNQPKLPAMLVTIVRCFGTHENHIHVSVWFAAPTGHGNVIYWKARKLTGALI